eukprot:6205176-Pleurochrysis_carterae.AAC.2
MLCARLPLPARRMSAQACECAGRRACAHMLVRTCTCVHMPTDACARELMCLRVRVLPRIVCVHIQCVRGLLNRACATYAFRAFGTLVLEIPVWG